MDVGDGRGRLFGRLVRIEYHHVEDPGHVVRVHDFRTRPEIIALEDTDRLVVIRGRQAIVRDL